MQNDFPAIRKTNSVHFNCHDLFRLGNICASKVFSCKPTKLPKSGFSQGLITFCSFLDIWKSLQNIQYIMGEICEKINGIVKSVHIRPLNTKLPKLEQESNFVEILHKSSNFTFSFQYMHIKWKRRVKIRNVLQRYLLKLFYFRQIHCLLDSND